MITTVIFDMYGVIIKESKGNFIPYVFQHFPDISINTIINNFNKAGIGEITSEEFITNLGFEGDYSQYEVDYVDNYLTFDEQFPQIISEIKKRFKIGLLSNDVSEWSKYIVKKHDIGKYFDSMIVSGDVGYRKPDERIYNHIINDMNESATNCIFIDNKVENLQIAASLGMKTILFNRDNVEYHGDTVYSFQELKELLKTY